MTPPEQPLAQPAAGRDVHGFVRRQRERKLVQWALAYLAGAWLVLQVFGAVSTSFGWRPAVGRVLIALLVAGLFVALVLAWYHGEQGRQRASGPELLMLAAPAAGRSVAVLPFANLSASRENEYFSDGVAEDILTNLSQVAGLRVISRTSAMAYRGSSKPLRQIAGELGVSHVVEGSVWRRASTRGLLWRRTPSGSI
ncbi:MAG TPA: hypothetical protein VFR37_04475 [Longimicrobium sp.]|nr:hypothetical protein [Longimicrobium sp.]